jgi:exonuclease SbcC
MIPLRLSLEGFLCYRERQEINFADSNIWLLWGHNGTGKSSIPDAITFAIYGKPRSVGVTHADLINHDCDRLIIEYDFQGVDGLIYRLRCFCSKEGQVSRSVGILSCQENGASEGIQITSVPNADSEQGFLDWRKRAIGLEYRAFTSSVLLMQGKSEQLLTMTPKERYETLSEFIELERYQKLYDAADKRRSNYKSEMYILEKQLGGISIVTDEQLATYAASLEEKEKEWKLAQEQVERIAALLERVKEREKLLKRREEVTQELRQAEEFLQHEEEIKAGFDEWQRLNQLIPRLRQIVEQRQRILETEQQITALTQQETDLLTALPRSEQEKTEAERLLSARLQDIEEIQKKLRDHLRRLAELNPLVERFEQIEKLQVQLNNVEQRLSDFPDDIEQQLQDAERRARELDEYAQVFPWLRQFAQTRVALAKVLVDEQQIQQEITRLDSSLQEARSKRATLSDLLSQAGRSERQLLEEKTKAGQVYEDAWRSLERFEHVAINQQCVLCGQPISPEHAHKEKARLRSLADEKRKAYDYTLAAHQKVCEQQADITQQIAALDGQIRELEGLVKEKGKKQQIFCTQSDHHSMHLQACFNNIPVAYRERIARVEPQTSPDWVQTIYPTNKELGVLASEAREKQSHQQYLEKLRSQHGQWRDLSASRQTYQQQLEQRQIGIDRARAEEARTEKETLEQQRQTLEDGIDQSKQAYQQAEQQARQARNRLEQATSMLQQCQSELKAQDAIANEQLRMLQSLRMGLPMDWQERALSLDGGKLRDMEMRKEALESYREQYEKLDTVHHACATSKKTIDELNKQLTAFSEEEQQDTPAVEQKLGDIKATAKDLDGQRNTARTEYAILQERQRQRQELSDQKKEAARMFHLYKILADLLGRNGLQRHLMMQAENEIIAFANEALHGLSRGRLRLELRKARSTAASPAGKALDLLVYDTETGKRPVPIGQISGSQRFRIAVSLALAIGRYSSGTRRGIESVIIDEGFGGLDKEGRDDMIDELTALGRQLSRIILVSHNEEFAQAFRKRYSFELVDHTTRVTLMADS